MVEEQREKMRKHKCQKHVIRNLVVRLLRSELDDMWHKALILLGTKYNAEKRDRS